MSGRRTLPLLTYDSIDDSGSVLSVAPRVFAEHMRCLHEAAVSTLSLPAAAEVLRGGPGPARAVVLTFDDGFANVYEHAYPMLRPYGLTPPVSPLTVQSAKPHPAPPPPPIPHP